VRRAADGTLRLDRSTDPAGALSPDDLVDTLCADQLERWRLGERVPAEAYLNFLDDCPGDSNEAFAIVYGEFVLREHLGETPCLEEYRGRFPQFGDRLRRHRSVYTVL